MRRRWGEAAPQPFRWPAPGAAGALLGYATDPERLADAPAAEPLPDWTADWDRDEAEPDILRAVFPSSVQARAMPSEWRAGSRFAFERRLRPVARYGARTGAEARAGHTRGERDAFLVAVERKVEGDPEIHREDVYPDWLADRMSPWATLETARLTAHRRIRTVRSPRGKPAARRLEGPEAVIEGVLRVEDGPGFAAALARGVGRHVAFGFGMLLLRPAGR